MYDHAHISYYPDHAHIFSTWNMYQIWRAVSGIIHGKTDGRALCSLWHLLPHPSSSNSCQQVYINFLFVSILYTRPRAGLRPAGPGWIVGRVQFSWVHFSGLASRQGRSAQRGQIVIQKTYKRWWRPPPICISSEVVSLHFRFFRMCISFYIYQLSTDIFSFSPYL